MTTFSSLDASSVPIFAWPPSFWVWDDRLKPHLSSDPGGCGLSCGQAFIGKSGACGSIDERIEPFQGVPLNIACVEAKNELIDVPFQMLLARLVIDALESALEYRPHALNAIGARRAPDVFIRRVIDALLLEEQAVQVVVGRVFIGVERGANRDMSMNRRLNVGDAGTLNRHRFGTSAALSHPQDSGFADGASSKMLFARRMFVALQAADECFVNLDFAAQLLQVLADSL